LPGKFEENTPATRASSEDDTWVSKSQRKRDAKALKTLASRLLSLGPSQFGQLPLEDAMREAMDEARQIRSNVARKRQLQYVAKLLRRTDPSAIIAALDGFENQARQLNASLHRAEAWRDTLLESGDQALGQLLSRRHDVDSQAIRQLLRNAKREADRKKPPAAARALFRMLRELDQSEPLPPCP
jgi:ribosome-associated protein